MEPAPKIQPYGHPFSVTRSRLTSDQPGCRRGSSGCAQRTPAVNKWEAILSGLLDEFSTVRLLGLDLVAAEVSTVAAALAARSGQERFSYVVTPNADHFVRLERNPAELMAIYRAAGSLHLDSRVVCGLAKMLRLPVPPVVTGSDLTLELFERWIDSQEPITVVGTTSAAVERLTARFGLSRVAHHCPPFGFERNRGLVEQCADFVEAHPARFIFLACGAPRQEILAHRICQRGRASGIGLCIGAAVDQISGYETRAPAWIRHNGLEWGWRVGRNPVRMGRRYLTDTKIIMLLLTEARRSRAEQ